MWWKGPLFVSGILLSCGSYGQGMVVGYLPNDADHLPAFLDTFDFGKVTHVDIAFENPDAEGNLSFHDVDRDIIVRTHSRHRKVMISIGGGGVAEDKVVQARYFDLLSAPKRAGFVAKLAAYVTQHNLDGIDVDIEGPSINRDYGAFIHDLSTALKAQGKLLSAALSQGYGGDLVPASVLSDLDFANLMAYDAVGSWNPNVPGQHASMEFAKQVVNFWVGRGLPKAKVILGLPFYGYGFGKAFLNGGYRYADIVKSYPGAETTDQVGETIWYNGIPTMQAKVKYVRDEGLGGVMIWELTQDASGAQSLLTAIQRAMRQ